MKPYKVIWLQYEESGPDWASEYGTTWCQDKINDDDVKYVLADEAERRVEYYKALNSGLLKRVQELIESYDRDEKRIVELEEGLQEYGRHKSGCGYFDPEVLDCTCGLSALKEGT